MSQAVQGILCEVETKFKGCKMLGCILMRSYWQDVATVKHLGQVRELTVSIRVSVSFLALCGWAGRVRRKVPEKCSCTYERWGRI